MSPGRRRSSKGPGPILRLLSNLALAVLLFFLGLFGLAFVASRIATRPAEVAPPSAPIAAANPSDDLPRRDPAPPPAGAVRAPEEVEADADAQPMATDDPRARSILQMGKNHERDARTRAAIRCYSEVCNAWPGTAEAVEALGRIGKLKGELDRAAMPAGITAPSKDLARREPRRRVAQDFSAVDAAFGSMGAAASGGGSSLCGAPTQSGAPCRNPVAGGGYCHLHR